MRLHVPDVDSTFFSPEAFLGHGPEPPKPRGEWPPRLAARGSGTRAPGLGRIPGVFLWGTPFRDNKKEEVVCLLFLFFETTKIGVIQKEEVFFSDCCCSLKTPKQG